jgi:hypothetical protein
VKGTQWVANTDGEVLKSWLKTWEASLAVRQVECDKESALSMRQQKKLP